MREIELLSPAKNLECGIAAIDHGADAVYIGAERFGARAAAGNSVEDIAELCRYAHQYGAKVYVTVNTIIFDEEMDATQQLIHQLMDVQVDALLVQDMGIVELVESGELSSLTSHLSPLTPHPSPLTSQLILHASTQTDNRTVEKVRWLRSVGFRRVVLARELSLAEIQEIHRAVPDVELEVFVHGALCVSYSGVCYASQHCFGRSANRGECAQFCRMKFDLVDADGRMIERGRHLLSLKDLCQYDKLEELLEAGAVSLKIEGRLKDLSYVKNVTAAYSEELNRIIAKHPDRYCRSSRGRCTYTFTPTLKKTFNRGFTHYFLNGRQPDIFSPDTPKAIGEYVGRVKELRGNSFTVAGTAAFANGDGLCFLNDAHELEGFRVNRAETNRLFPLKMPHNLRPGMALYRNHDMEFERLMSGKSAERKIAINMTLNATPEGFCLQAAEPGLDGYREVEVRMEKQQAEKPQRENIVRQLSKMGGTPYECHQVRFSPEEFNYFIPSSILSDMRRRLVEVLTQSPFYSTQKEEHADSFLSSQEIERATNDKEQWNAPSPLYTKFPYLYNISNQQAQQFYKEQGLKNLEPAFELQQRGEALLMQCRHCLRYSLGYCTKRGGRKMPWKEPLQLVLGDGRQFRLQFDCRSCQMNIFAKSTDK